MAFANLKALVGKLNTTCRRGLEGAGGICLSRTNYNVEIEHWLIKLLEPADTDLTRIFQHYNVDGSKVNRELTRALDKLKTGNARPPSLSLEILNLVREAWVYTSLEYKAKQIRSGYLLATLLADEKLARPVLNSSPELENIPGPQLEKDVRDIIQGSAEDEEEPVGASEAGEPGQAPVDSKTPSLDQFTLNLTERARKGEIDPVIGRDFEIRQVIDILTRRRQNNPILTGEAGVGKTAVVEGFALQINAGDVPDPLKKVVVRTLDLGLLQAGAGVKGEFENRLKSVIQEVKSSPVPIILFIDEAHTLIGAGGSAGQGDAANLLKPALARGELRTIAATTWNEYKKYFETDAALKRRFQVVKVDEPDIVKAIRMMRGLANTMEKHHKVRVLDQAVEEAVKLGARYITDRQLPDKSVSLLDTACARVALSQSALAAPIQDCRREIEHLKLELEILDRETVVGADHSQRRQEIEEQKAAAESRLEALEKQWQEEKELVEQIQEFRSRLEAHLTSGQEGGDPEAKLEPEEENQVRTELKSLDEKLVQLQGETPLVLPVVNAQAIAEVVAGWTGIPVGKMVRDEINAVLSLKEKLEERVIGQSHALDSITQRIRTSRANLTDPRRPIGVFMLVGPSGVGKTETAVALADLLYGGDRNMVVINMSEYKEDHKISRLTGSAPGYVGYGEGGVLTEAVRRKPYSIVLLDEIEKANEAVQEIFYQVFDKGMLQDDKGNEINFKNTIILLTSNVGTDTIVKLCADPETAPDAEGLRTALQQDLLKVFKPAFVGRLNVIPYFPLSDEVLQKIINLKLKQITGRILENHRAQFTYDDALVQTIASRCKEVESGARNVDHILTGTLLPDLAGEFLSRMADGTQLSRAHVSVNPEGGFKYEVR